MRGKLMESKRARHTARIVGLALAALAMAVPSAGAHSKHGHKHGHHHGQGSVDVQLLGINHFHGQLEPGPGSGGRIGSATDNVPAGGAEYLATHIRELEQGNRNSLVVTAGDLI